MDKFIRRILLGFNLYMITIIYPMVTTIFVTILGFFYNTFTGIFNWIETILSLWIKYYYNGYLYDVVAWKIHLVLLILCILYTLTSDE